MLPFNLAKCTYCTIDAERGKLEPRCGILDTGIANLYNFNFRSFMKVKLAGLCAGRNNNQTYLIKLLGFVG